MALVARAKDRRWWLVAGCVALAATAVGCGAVAEIPATIDGGDGAEGCPARPDAGNDAGGGLSANAPPIVVDTVDSEKGPVNGKCSLFMAVTALGNRADFGGCKKAASATSISIPAGTFDISSGLTIPSAAKGPAVSLVGRGVGLTILDTNGSVSPAIEIDGSTVTLSQLTVRATKPAKPTTGLRLDKSALVTLDHMKVTGFTLSGVWNADANLTVYASTLDGNSNPQFGGGLYQGAQDATASPTTFVNYSTVSNNTAPLGGGIYSLGYLNLTYSTIAGNKATGGKGGGIYMGQDYLETAHCTIAFNSATSTGRGGGIYIDPDVQTNVHVNSSIIANNTGSPVAPDFSGLLRDRLTRIYDRNLLGSASGVTAGKGQIDLIEDPLLGPLGDYGGPTQTCALLKKSSPAVDASRDFSAKSATDQRFYCGPYGSAYDVGAFEWRPVPAQPVSRILVVVAPLVGVMLIAAVAMFVTRKVPGSVT